MKKKINILLADDHKIFLEGLELALQQEEDIQVLGACLNGNYAIARIRSIMKSGTEKLDVAVLDINMPELDGIGVTRMVKAEYPDIKVLMLTMFNTVGFVRQLRQESVDGYLLKESSVQELVSAIHAVYNGKTYYSQSVMEKVMDAMGQPAKKEESVLTEREKEVIQQIGLGRQTPEIARVLNIAPNTVDTHRRNILNKLNLRNSLELVRYAIYNGFVDAPQNEEGF